MLATQRIMVKLDESQIFSSLPSFAYLNSFAYFLGSAKPISLQS